MILFEIKKVFSKSMSKIALLVLVAALVIVSILTINNLEYIDYSDGQNMFLPGLPQQVNSGMRKMSGPATLRKTCWQK